MLVVVHVATASRTTSSDPANPHGCSCLSLVPILPQSTHLVLHPSQTALSQYSRACLPSPPDCASLTSPHGCDLLFCRHVWQCSLLLSSPCSHISSSGHLHVFLEGPIHTRAQAKGHHPHPPRLGSSTKGHRQPNTPSPSSSHTTNPPAELTLGIYKGLPPTNSGWGLVRAP